MAAKAGTLVLSLAALCFSAFANVPRRALVAEKPHQGVAEFAPTANRGIAAGNALIAPGLCGCLCDSGRRSRSTGKERDAETGLDYFGARYMSAAQGRFTSPDLPLIAQRPGDPQSWNLYSYTRNNPLRYVDRDGRQDLPPHAGCNGDKECENAANHASREVFEGVVNGAAVSLQFALCPLCGPEEVPFPAESNVDRVFNFMGEIVGGYIMGAGISALSEFLAPSTPVTQFVSKDVTFTHFTDAKGVKGITGVDPASLKPGQGATVDTLRFGTGSNSYNANRPGDIFVTSLPPSASSLQLSQIGVSIPKQSFAISFSGTSAMAQGVRVTSTPLPNIYTIPGNTVLKGCANLFCLK